MIIITIIIMMLQEFASLPDVGKLTFPRFPKLPLGASATRVPQRAASPVPAACGKHLTIAPSCTAGLFVPSAPPPALDLLGKLLQLNPARRISATEVRDRRVEVGCCRRACWFATGDLGAPWLPPLACRHWLTLGSRRHRPRAAWSSRSWWQDLRDTRGAQPKK